MENEITRKLEGDIKRLSYEVKKLKVSTSRLTIYIGVLILGMIAILIFTS
jgi:hypothetical protein